MKIWIIGKKCGLINVITKRLQKEGHKVNTNFNDDKASKSIDINDVNYNFISTTEVVKKAFYDFNPDVVIYTGYYNDAFIENKNTTIHLTELVNILNLCINSTVNRFIYLSSYEVYESADVGAACTETMDLKSESIRGYGLLEGENLVKRWSDFSKKIGIIFRTAPVYGEIAEESWNSFHNLNTLLDIRDNKEITIPFYESNPLHINDLADALVKSFDLVSGGLYNVAGNEVFTNETFGQTLKDVIFKESTSIFKAREKLKLILDNKRIKNELEWEPKYNCKEGIRVSIQNNKKEISKAIKKRKNEDKREGKTPFLKRHFFRRILLALEAPLLFLIVATICTFCRNMNILQSVNVFIIYIAFVSTIHSITKSLLSAVFSSIFLIGLKFYQGYDLVNSLFDVSNIFIIIQYFLVWAIISYTIERYKETVISKTETIKRMKKDKDDMEELNNMNTNIKNQLLSNMAGYRDSLGKLYSVIDQLDSADPAEIYEKLPYVLQQIMNCRDVSIYRISNNQFMRLHISTCQDGRSFGHTVNLKDYPELMKMIDENEIYTNMSLNPNMPMMAAPIISDGKPIDVIFLWNMSFSETTTYFKNKLKTLSLLIAKNLERANTYLSTIHEERHIKDTEILNKESYLEILSKVKSLEEKDMANFLLLKVLYEGDLEELSQKLVKLLRNTDYAGINSNGQVECILSNTTIAFSESILQRFLEGGVKCEVIS